MDSPLPSTLDAPLGAIKFDAHGLIPAIIQDAETRDVLMMAWMNADSLAKTVETGLTHFYSRSRAKLWLKGETSGHTQRVRWIRTDCDQDVLLIGVDQTGAACHDGYRTCFYREHARGAPDWRRLGSPLVDPKTVYGNK
jgi:phosphoribosyl-AMP cyclohydrolase